ncbi:MAG: restriction endonuclease [Prevotella sp.]
MRILIEEYQYSVADEKRRNDLKVILQELGGFENLERKVSVNCVGYYYSTQLKDCVFILPKVLLSVTKDKGELVFGEHRPEDIINIDSNTLLTEQQKRFIYEFAVWIYRAIDVYRTKNSKSQIIYYRHIAKVGNGRRRMSNTFLDVLLSLIQFNKDNQNFFFFTLRNQHSGLNKINWTKTISRSRAFINDDGCPVYMNPINKKRCINFDEELLVIFFSILNYINDTYGFAAEININFPLIPKYQFENMMKGMGKIRLCQIKYKYFSDKALQLWELCYAFFDRAHKVSMSPEIQDYLLAKNFNIVFEDIIDELIGDHNIPAGLKEQDDGKLVDHMYTYKGLTTYEEDKPIYYIGDSKYYKRGSQIGKESVYKQFTYARNVIQWNLNLFMNDDTDDSILQYDKKNFGNVPKLRDDVTEGYNVIPNFFISAKLDDNLSYQDRIEITDKQNTHFTNSQFKNRLFDRDTLLVCHYDVNFLYVVSLYARNNNLQKQTWKNKVRKMFRSEIQKMLSNQYNFYAMQAHPNEDARKYLREHFQQTLGKVFTPFNNSQIFSLALDKTDPEGNNDDLLAELRKHFFIIENSIGNNPEGAIAEVVEKEKIKYIYSETEAESLVLVGCIRSDAQRIWIMNEGKYNIRLNNGKKIDGAITPDRAFMNINHLLLYREDDMSIDYYYNIAKENSAPQFAGIDTLKSSRYPFNVRKTPQQTFEKRLEEKYRDRMYLMYEINTTPIPFQNGIKIDLQRLLESYNNEGTPIGTPFVIPFKDLINYYE